MQFCFSITSQPQALQTKNKGQSEQLYNSKPHFNIETKRKFFEALWVASLWPPNEDASLDVWTCVPQCKTVCQYNKEFTVITLNRTGKVWLPFTEVNHTFKSLTKYFWHFQVYLYFPHCFFSFTLSQQNGCWRHFKLNPVPSKLPSSE